MRRLGGGFVLFCICLLCVSGYGQDAEETLVIYDYIDDDGNLVDGAMSYEMIDLSEVTSLIGTSGSRNVETVLNNGPPCNRLDLVMLGDGYTEDDLDTYADHVEALLDIFDTEPLTTYKNFFNVHRVDVISDESGVDNDPTDGIEVDTALNMGFFCGGTERALCISTAAAFAAADNAPEWDQILALANSTKYGGTAQPSNDLAMVSGGNGSRVQVAVHEIGHSLGDLADEYTYGGSATYTGSEPSAANVSIHEYDDMEEMETKWWQWLDNSGVGFDGNHDTYEGGMYSSSGIYRPTNNSCMRNLGRPFNLPSAEALILEIYSYVNPIDKATPGNKPLHGCSEVFVDVIDPIGHEMDIAWYLDDELLEDETDLTLNLADLDLEVGEYVLEVLVTDNTDWVIDESARENWMTETREWDIVVLDENGNDIPDGCEDISTLLQLWDACQQVGPACGTSGYQLGGAVALDGNYAFAGALGADIVGNSSGAVYAYVYDSGDDVWVPGPNLNPSELESGDQFGNSIAMTSSRVVVGAHLADSDGNDAGAVYVFNRSGSDWNEDQRIVPDATAAGDRFGSSVDISGLVLVAGAIRDDDAGSNSGSAFVYRRTGGSWNEEVQLDPEEVSSGDNFGAWVCIEGNTIAVAAPGDDSGAVYIFRYDGAGDWPQEQRITVADLDDGAKLGTCIDIRDDWMAISAPRTDGDEGANLGSIFMFEFDAFDETWEEFQELTASDKEESHRLGRRLRLHERGLTASATGDVVGSGSLYGFRYDDDNDEWVEFDKTRAPDAEDFDEFGSGFAIDGDLMFVGSHRDDVGGLSSGSGYFMRVSPELTAWPESDALCDGDIELLTIETDTTGVSYQWRKDGEDLDGETGDTLALVNVSTTDAGVYECVVTKGCTLSVSPAATFTVSEVDPEIVSVDVEVDLLEVTVTAELEGDGLDIVWDLGDGNTSTESSFVHEYASDGSYTLELTVSNGCGEDTYSSTINVGDTQFIRGDVDGNAVTFPIVDALYLLDYGFTNGPLPPCLDAADVDGDNSVFPIIDALYLLDYGFTNGPSPPDPGPEDCGADPDDDDVDCADASACA